jgi:hypothetical protein
MQLQQNIGCWLEPLEQIDHRDPGSSVFSGGFAPFGSRAAKAVNPRPLLLWKMMPVHLRMPSRPISYDESGMVNDGLRMPLPVRLDHHPQQLPCSCPVLTSEQREV